MKLNAIKEMEIYTRLHPEVISLGQGIPFMPSDERIRNAVTDALLDNKVDSYSDPQGILELRTKISRQLTEEDMQYSVDEIIVTAGAIEGISAALLTLLNTERNEVIVPTPTYSAYFRSIEIAGGKSICVKLNEHEGWKLDVNELKKKIGKETAVILICNPNNPTGSIYSKNVLTQICRVAKEKGIFVILDEVYKNMIYGEGEYYTPATDKNFKDNIIRVVSFSKDFSLTGWRVGFIHSSSKLIEKILPVHDGLINCVPVISQYAAISAIENNERILSDNREIYFRQMQIMKSYLDKMSNYFSYIIPQGSYFFFPKFKFEQDSRSFCMDLLQKSKLAVIPGSEFGVGGEGHVRICFGRGEKAVRGGMERLGTYFIQNKSNLYAFQE